MLYYSRTHAYRPDTCLGVCLALVKTRCRTERTEVHSTPLPNCFQLQLLYGWVASAASAERY